MHLHLTPNGSKPPFWHNHSKRLPRSLQSTANGTVRERNARAQDRGSYNRAQQMHSCCPTIPLTRRCFKTATALRSQLVQSQLQPRQVLNRLKLKSG